MQAVSNGDNLHRMSNPVFWEIITLSSTETRVVHVKVKET